MSVIHFGLRIPYSFHFIAHQRFRYTSFYTSRRKGKRYTTENALNFERGRFADVMSRVFFLCRQEVMRETKCLYTVRDPNLVRIVGVCSPDEPLCIVQEYCEYGDLPNFLKLQTAESTEDHPTIK